MLTKVSGVARLLALLAAVVGVFVAVPYVAVILVVLGLIAGLSIEEDALPRVLLGALLLTLTAKSFEVIPQVGGHLASILGNLGLAYVGAATMALLLAFARRIRSDWAKPSA